MLCSNQQPAVILLGYFGLYAKELKQLSISSG